MFTFFYKFIKNKKAYNIFKGDAHVKNKSLLSITQQRGLSYNSEMAHLL